MAREFDSPWKEALDLELEPLLQLLAPDMHALIDWTQPPESLDTEFAQIVRDAELGATEVDKLVRVRLTDGSERWLLLHIEVQAQPDASLAQRMFVYYYRIRDRYNERVWSLAVLGDDRPNWRPGPLVEEIAGCRLRFEYRTAKLLELEETAEAAANAGNPLGLVIAAHLASLRTHHQDQLRFEVKWALIRRLLGAGLKAKRLRNIYRLIDWLLDLTKGLSEQLRIKEMAYRKEHKMPYVTNYERVVQAEYVELGRAEGKAEGERLGLVKAIKIGCELKFGKVPRTLSRQLAKLTETAELEEVLEQIQTSSTHEEFTQRLRNIVS